MKQSLKRTISFLMSICIIVISVLLYPIPAYANSGNVHPDPSKPLGNIFVEGAKYALFYVSCQIGAVLGNYDFYTFMQNKSTWNDYWNGDNITEVTDDDGNVISYTFSEELVDYIKQALIEYAEETNPFKLEKTYNMYEIPASTFGTKAAYNAFRSYCSSHHFTVALPQSSVKYMYLADATPYIKDGGAFVSSANMVVVIDSDWKGVLLPYDYYQLKVVDGNDIVDITESRGTIQWIAHYDPKKTDFGVYKQNPFIVTPDGGRIRVFKNVTEFMNYDAGQRKVFFGSGFYDFDPTDITATWDEINDKIGRMDDLLQDIIDAITDNPNISEEDLEKLIDELIGKIGEIGGQIGDKTDQTNTILGGISSTLDGITSSLSGYFSSVLSKLNEILAAIKSLVWIEADNKVDEDKQDLFDLIDKIWQDPENGSQEAADALTGSFSDVARGLTKKFPFSIPWDIYNLFRVFSGAPAPDEAAFHTMTLGAKPFTVDNEDLEQDIHDAPFFKLPLRLDSYGIYEEVVIDLADFKSVSTLSRGLLSVLFAVFLIKFTIRIIELFKGGAGN